MTGTHALVLGYHDVECGSASSGFQGPGARRYKLGLEDFRRHLCLLEAAGYRPTGVIRGIADTPVAGVVHALTFDDGGSCAPYIADLLEDRGWRGHFFAVTSLIGADGFADARTLVDLAARGHLVGTHSHSHPSMLANLDPAVIAEEWSRSAVILSDLMGSAVTTGSVPGGSMSRTVVRQAAAAGIEVLFTSDPKVRVSFLDRCAVIGRYQLTAADSAGTAAALARGVVGARIRRRVAWSGRRVAHRVLGSNYLRLREAVLSRGMSGSDERR